MESTKQIKIEIRNRWTGSVAATSSRLSPPKWAIERMPETNTKVSMASMKKLRGRSLIRGLVLKMLRTATPSTLPADTSKASA